ncbi:hypothetical protein MN116_004745 [Schistosoma mekongi]|uniref:Mothers against decapentaplegic homolog n=1 Tax=Schistosoma mekongi TaxID=38744 RepID=A0AAE1ZBL4_SCHME|nr:hypothetical protein MN116_004745 [Schistosoma mekongi]
MCLPLRHNWLMIRKIVNFRRVSRARDRIISLVTDSISVQAIVLDLSATGEVLGNQVHLDSITETILFFFKCFLSEGLCTETPTGDLYAQSFEALVTAQLSKSDDWLQKYGKIPFLISNLSLLHIISAFVHTLSPDDALSLDSALKFGHESYFNLMKSQCSFPKAVNFHSGLVDSPGCVHSISRLTGSAKKCPKYRKFRQFQPGSRYVVGLRCSQYNTSRSKWLQNDYAFSNDGISKTSVYCIDLLLAVCKAWRWGDLSPGDWLRRIGPCQFSQKHIHSQICLNPYHWSRVLVRNKIDEKVQCSRYSCDPNIVCLGLKHIINPIHDYAESHFEASNVNSEYPKDVLSLLSPSTLFSPLSSSSSSRESTSSTETQIRPICLDQSYDSVTSYDPMTNNLTTPLLNTKTKLGYCSSQVFHKLQHKLHINLLNYNSDLSKLKNLSKTNQKSFEDLNYVNDKALQNSNLYCNQHITMHNHSATISNNRKNYIYTTRHSSSTPQHHLKPWANISYWELHHHVGRRWYHVTNRTLNIIYDDVDNEVGDNKLYSSSPKHVHSIHKVNHSSYRSKSQNDCIYLALLTLYQSNDVKYNCKSDCSRTNNESSVNVRSSNNNSSIIQSSSKRCRKCNHYVNSFNTPSLSPNIIVHSSLHKSSFGWKQCYRLGNQGISLTLTTYGCVWLSNQAIATNLPIFVSSPCLQPINDVNSSSSLSSSTDDFIMDRPVYRVPAGYSLLVFDILSYEKSLQQQSSPSSSSASSSSSSSCRQYNSNNLNNNNNYVNDDELNKTHLLVNNNYFCKNPIIHISLGKGWGPAYRRPDVTHCPARLEVWINLEHLFLYSLHDKH